MLEDARIDARAGNRAADPVEHHHQQGEQNPVPEFRYLADVEKCGDHSAEFAGGQAWFINPFGGQY
jgi:hypothetical protein